MNQNMKLDTINRLYKKFETDGTDWHLGPIKFEPLLSLSLVPKGDFIYESNLEYPSQQTLIDEEKAPFRFGGDVSVSLRRPNPTRDSSQKFTNSDILTLIVAAISFVIIYPLI